ncbi:heterokaryon incompatibility protein-domain-containing protein [Hyaloscypha sp. PMI_1271]|nr:heterokaryon incompatibility protein-domain-containing protein [Hyaloscypha sp. PMI_1271]
MFNKLYHAVFILLGILSVCGLLPRLPLPFESAVVGYWMYMQFLLSKWISAKYLSPFIESFIGLCFYVRYSISEILSSTFQGRDIHSALVTALGSKTVTPQPDSTPQHPGPLRSSPPRTSTVKPTYQYQPLSGENEIRLLELFPNPNGEAVKPLECRIVHTRLDEKPQYVALSYCWVDDALEGEYSSHAYSSLLHCYPAGSLVLTKNLINALLGIRHKEKYILLWVDQICIDQQNDMEKSSQVALMKEIYSNASLVRVWLGDEAGKVQGAKAFKLATRIAKSVDETDILTQPLSLLQMDPQTCSQYQIPSLQEAADDYLALVSLLDRPWFTRSWVVQEVSLNLAIVSCGTAEIPFISLSKALFCCGIPLAVPFPAQLEANESFYAMVRAAVSFKGDIRRPSRALLDILVQHRCCKATKSQDKIFAFLSLADDAEEIGVTADYSIDTRHVYLKTAVAMLEYYKHLDILSVAKPLLDVSTLQETKTGQSGDAILRNYSNDLDPLSTLPSWVPNWDISTVGPSLRSRGLYGEHFGDFCASKTSTRKVQFRGAETQLSLHGYILDQIVDVGHVFDLNRLSDTGKQYATFQQWESLCNARSGQIYKITGEDMLTAYCMTLTCGGEAVIARGVDSINDAVSSTWNYEVPGRPLPDDEAFSAQYLFYLLTLRNSSVIKALGFDPLRTPFLYTILVVIFPFMSVFVDGILELIGGQRAVTKMSQIFSRRLTKSITGRRFVRTQGGYIGLAVFDARRGDHIAVFAGGAVPLVVRDTGEREVEEKEWKLVGDAYIHGIMFGKDFNEDRCQPMWFV